MCINFIIFLWFHSGSCCLCDCWITIYIFESFSLHGCVISFTAIINSLLHLPRNWSIGPTYAEGTCYIHSWRTLHLIKNEGISYMNVPFRLKDCSDCFLGKFHIWALKLIMMLREGVLNWSFTFWFAAFQENIRQFVVSSIRNCETFGCNSPT